MTILVGSGVMWYACKKIPLQHIKMIENDLIW